MSFTKNRTILEFTACKFFKEKMSEFEKLNKKLAKTQYLKKIKANHDIMSDHFYSKNQILETH